MDAGEHIEDADLHEDLREDHGAEEDSNQESIGSK